MDKITRAQKQQYELLALKWARKQTEGDLEGAKILEGEILEIEHRLGMTAEEILDSNPGD